MSDLYNFIIEQTESLNPALRLFIVFVLSGLAFTGISLIKNESFRKHFILFFKNFFRSKSKISLLKHNLFFKKTFFLKAINNLHFESTLKTELFKIILTEKIKTALSLTEAFIKTIDCKLSDSELFFQCSENISNIISAYEESIEQAFVDYFFENKELTKKEAYIIARKEYEFIYATEDIGFKDVHGKNVNYILKSIEKNISSKAFTQKQKLYFYLTAIDIALEISITDCENIFNKFNGEIDKLAKKS
jgi:hypothetical protein